MICPNGPCGSNDGVGGAGFVAIPLQELGELTPQGFALHAALLSYGWRGSCWPGMDKLGARTRMGEKALRAAKDELIESRLARSDAPRPGQAEPLRRPHVGSAACRIRRI
jgi:hypothetical protein